MPVMRSVASVCLSGMRRRAFAQILRLRPTSQISWKQTEQARWLSQDFNKLTTFRKTQGNAHLDSTAVGEKDSTIIDFTLPPESALSDFYVGAKVTIHGFLGKRRDVSKDLTFCDLDTSGEHKIQLVALAGKDSEPALAEVFHQFKKLAPFIPVAATGILKHSKTARGHKPNNETDGLLDPRKIRWDLRLTEIKPLNSFNKNIVVSKDAVWLPHQRHVQLRFDPLLRHRLNVRSMANFTARKYLMDARFQEYETPILFKSTPEGAREFIVPTRQQGLAYALPQSPQQYKQVLMASGFRKYFQFARCFRDEDSRADRQPEFTQLDLEMAFATGKDVMRTVENIVESIFTHLRTSNVAREVESVLYTDPVELARRYGPAPHTTEADILLWPLQDTSKNGFVRIKYDDAMSKFGSDKPDLRIPSEIKRIEAFLSDDFRSMITDLKDPIVEATQFRLNGTPSQNHKFIRKFMENLKNTTLKLNPGSTPGVFVFDATKPLNGLAAFGHEAGQYIADMQTEGWSKLEHGDLLIVHAREKAHFQGEGWTELGRLRKAIYDAAVQEGLIDRDISFRFCWITDFPLFTTDIEPGEGQGGSAGLKATHHPFTAPLESFTIDDFENLLARGRPWEIKADHYDLVLNGTEVGGGSRRIHQRGLQEYVMKKILKMPDSGLKQFEHLFEALEAGCPPHAGFAIGWDRFITLICGVDSVRDVVAFPKNQKGEDLFAKSPSQLTDAKLHTYHLKARDWQPQDAKSC